MLRGFAPINYWAADLAAAKQWYSKLLGIGAYFERAELDGRIIGRDDPDHHRVRLGYVEFRIVDDQHELGLIDSRYAPGGPPSSRGGVVLYWHVDDVRAAVEKLLSTGEKEYLPITEREAGIVTTAVADPFGNILGPCTTRTPWRSWVPGSRVERHPQLRQPARVDSWLACRWQLP